MAIGTPIKTILWITLAWTIVAIFQSLMSIITLLQIEYEVTDEILLNFIKTSLISGLMAGILGGSMVVFGWLRWFRNLSYKKSLLYIFISFTIVYFIVSIVSSLFFQTSRTDMTFNDSALWAYILTNLFSLPGLIPYTYWLVVVLGTMIAMLVNDKYGPGIFMKFLLGRYFHPKKEERVFMFLDLRSSTSIAENLGERAYFEFLKELYRDITPSILKFKGEIYQYVGDEVVVSWPIEEGLSNTNCINAFFDVKETLRVTSEYYQNTYGIKPEFKAGLHYGNAVAGEIGVVKRDIAYSGDVLNTTSRIQSQCNPLGVDLLISEDLTSRLDFSLTSYQPKPMGRIQLRGKKAELELFTAQ